VHNTPKHFGTASAPFIDHIRGSGGKSARRRRSRENRGDSDDASVGEFLPSEWTGATTKRPSQFPSLLHTIQIVCRGTKNRRFFTIPGPPFNFSPTNTRTELSRRVWDSRRIDFFRFPNRPGRDDYSLRSRRATRDRRDPRVEEFIRSRRRISIDALITRKICLANTLSTRTANDYTARLFRFCARTEK